MHYYFQDLSGDDISSNQNKAELIKSVRAYYKGLAIYNDETEYEVEGFIIELDQFDEVTNKTEYYEAGRVPSCKWESPYQQSQFV